MNIKPIYTCSASISIPSKVTHPVRRAASSSGVRRGR